MANKLYLVDGSGFIFRAYHALPAMTRPDGTPIGAVYGFCNMMVKLQKELQASHIAVIFDAGRMTFRQDIYADYKAHRPETPEDLIPQFALIKEATRAFGIPSVELAGFEADDLIASYALAARRAGDEVIIVSGDKDLMQLVGNGISILDPIKNKVYNPPEVEEKFGVPPHQVIEVQALAGDSADNVPGVPGIGIKTAAELIRHYGTVENLLAHTHEIKQPKRRETLEQNADKARISHQLVSLALDAPLPLPLEELIARPADDLAEFLAKIGSKSLMSRLNLTAPAPTQQENISAPILQSAENTLSTRAEKLSTAPKNYECVQTESALIKWCAKIRAQFFVAIDTETNSLTPSTAKLVGISLSTQAGDACYIPIGHGTAAGMLDFTDAPVQLPLAIIQQHLAPILADTSILKIGHNIKFDMQVLAAHGLPITTHDDTMLISYALGAGLHNHSCDELCERYFNHKMIAYKDVTGTGKSQITFDQVPIEQATQYAAEDADYTLRLWQLLKPELNQQHLTTVYETFERPLAPVIAQMETDGVQIDPLVLQQLSHRFAKNQAAIELEIFKLAGQEFNVGSPKQLGDILFDVMQIPGGVKGKTGAYATGVEVLEPLAEQGYEIAEKVLEWRGLAKLRSTYTDALQEQINARTGRVHTSFSLASTSTGRLSSSDPNLQNIPIRTDDGKAIRGAFITQPNCKLISVDYSQIELRLVAAIANIGAMIEAFQNKVDIHALTASQVLGVPLAEVTSAQRRSAKAINFGIIYGISGFGLAKQIGVSNSEATNFIKEYLNRFHELRSFMEAKKAEAREKGYVETYYGRRIHTPGINDKNGARRAFAERQAINAPIQGTAADIMKRAMIALPTALKAAGLSSKLILQVHDELVLEAPADQAEETARIAVQVMENAAKLSVPLTAEYGIADNWADAH